jgi:WD40-like Beta Propeller Repeat
MRELVSMRGLSFARGVVVMAALASGIVAGCGGGGGASDDSGGGGTSGGASGTLYLTEALRALTLNVATGQETVVTGLSIASQGQLGYGGGMFTDVEVTGVEPIQVKINLRDASPSPYALRSSLGPFPFSLASVAGPVRPSPDGKLFVMNTDEGVPGSRFVYVFDAALDIVFKLKDYYHPVWLGNDRLVVARDNNLYTLTVAASPVVTRIGPDGLGLPGEGTAVPSVSPDGRSIAFLQGQAVWRINVDGTGLAKLTKSSVGMSFPSWSPDGSRLIVSNLCRSSVDKFVIISATETNQDRDAITPVMYACGPVYWLP